MLLVCKYMTYTFTPLFNSCRIAYQALFSLMYPDKYLKVPAGQYLFKHCSCNVIIQMVFSPLYKLCQEHKMHYQYQATKVLNLAAIIIMSDMFMALSSFKSYISTYLESLLTELNALATSITSDMFIAPS